MPTLESSSQISIFVHTFKGKQNTRLLRCSHLVQKSCFCPVVKTNRMDAQKEVRVGPVKLPLPNLKVTDQSFSCRSLWHWAPLTSLISEDFVSYLMIGTIFQLFHTHCLTNTVKKNSKYPNLSTWSPKTEDLESPKSSSSSIYIPINVESRWFCF